MVSRSVPRDLRVLATKLTLPHRRGDADIRLSSEYAAGLIQRAGVERHALLEHEVGVRGRRQVFRPSEAEPRGYRFRDAGMRNTVSGLGRRSSPARSGVELP